MKPTAAPRLWSWTVLLLCAAALRLVSAQGPPVDSNDTAMGDSEPFHIPGQHLAVCMLQHLPTLLVNVELPASKQRCLGVGPKVRVILPKQYAALGVQGLLGAAKLNVTAGTLLMGVKRGIDNWNDFSSANGIQGWSDATPVCQWTGILCSSAGRVIGMYAAALPYSKSSQLSCVILIGATSK